MRRLSQVSSTATPQPGDDVGDGSFPKDVIRQYMLQQQATAALGGRTVDELLQRVDSITAMTATAGTQRTVSHRDALSLSAQDDPYMALLRMVSLQQQHQQQ